MGLIFLFIAIAVALALFLLHEQVADLIAFLGNRL